MNDLAKDERREWVQEIRVPAEWSPTRSTLIVVAVVIAVMGILFFSGVKSSDAPVVCTGGQCSQITR